MFDKIPTKRLRHLARFHLKYGKRPRRYRQLLKAAATLRPACILEIGVHTGQRAVEMIEAASLDRPVDEIEYHGFDLFEEMDGEILKRELSKKPDPMAAVAGRLRATGARTELHKGPSHVTLPAFATAQPGLRADLIFIDGGHAIETIREDWENTAPLLSQGGTTILDDYYVECPHLTERFGCNSLLETLDAGIWSWRVLPDIDRFVHDGHPHNVAMVEVHHKGGM